MLELGSEGCEECCAEVEPHSHYLTRASRFPEKIEKPGDPGTLSVHVTLAARNLPWYQQDGQALFTTLYRSWCHDPVSIFSLCLLAQAYEHASSLLHIL